MSNIFETILPWGVEERQESPDGQKIVRYAHITEGTPEATKFWLLWRTAKEEVRRAGIKIWKNDDNLWRAKWERFASEESVTLINEALDASVRIETDFQPPKPVGLNKNYFNYQRAGIEFALKRKNTFIADQIRLGKTIQTIGFMNSLGSDVLTSDMMDSKLERVLIMCPSTVKINWTIELNLWLTKNLSIGMAEGNFFPETDIVVMNYDLLPRNTEKLHSVKWSLIVADEVHYLKNVRSLRGEIGLGLRADRILALSGTPLDKLKDLYHVLHWLDEKSWPSKHDFDRRYIKPLDWGRDTSVELQRKLRSTIMVRRLMHEVWKDLPPKMHQPVILPASLSDEMQDLLTREKELFEKVSKTKLSNLTALFEAKKTTEELEVALRDMESGTSVDFGEIALVRHEVGRAKVPYDIAHIRFLIDDEENPGYKLVVFAHHRDVIEAIVKEFDGRCVKLVGGMTSLQKQKAIETFEKDPAIQLFVGHIQAAGEGISLAVADHIVYLELDWRPLVMEQSSGRCDHPDKNKTIFLQYLAFEGSLDFRMAEVIRDKSETIRKTLNATQESIDGLKLKVQPLPDIKIDDLLEKAKKKRIDEYRENNLSEEVVNAVHFCLRLLADDCDGAVERDGMGYNGIDSAFGKSLARCDTLSVRQAVAGRNLLRKYRGQLPTDLYETIFMKKKEAM